MIRRWTLALLAAMALPTAGRAQALADYDYENLSFQGFGFDLGYIWPNKVEPTVQYGLRFDLGFLGPGVRIVPSVSYWSSELKASELGRLADQFNRLPALQERGVTVGADELGTIDWSDFSLSLDGHYAWTTASGLVPFLGLGTALHILNGRGEAIEDTFVEDLLDTVTAGVSAIAGLEFEPIERLRVFAEGRYTLMTDLRYPTLKIGAALTLPTR
jgi:opacity protein-like surface antigen